MFKYLLALVFSLPVLAAFSQTTIKGRIYDPVAGKGLSFATVSLVNKKDSTLVTFSLADSSGRFTLNKVNKGDYLLSASYVGYVPMWKALTDMPAEGEYQMGDVGLTEIGRMQDATVTGRRPPVEINNDTVEFNSENFKTQPNAVVEDMLRKMPGVTIDADGTVKVNGQKVKRILVNGKEFFTGDVKMATKNLNADVVDKVQVFDRKSDQAAFTGVDDGNSEKTINLKLKKDKNHAIFGKVAAGAGSGGGGGAGVGNEARYDGQTNINKFNGDQQFSFLGMGNNTNKQGFSLMDVMSFTGEMSRGMQSGGGAVKISVSSVGDNNGLPVTGLGQNQQGVARTVAGGFNYNDSWDKGRGSLNTNYTVSNIKLQTNRRSLTQLVGSGDSYSTFDTSAAVNTTTQHRLAGILDQQVDSSFSFRLTPTLVWQHSDKRVAETYSSLSPMEDLLNAGFSNNNTGPGAFNFSTNLLLRKKLAKKGRTLSGTFSTGYNHSTQDGRQVSDNQWYQGGGVIDSNINQLSNQEGVTRSFGGNVTYTEPIGKRSLVALNGFYNVNTGNSDKFVYGFDPLSGKKGQQDSSLSNQFGSDYRYGGGGISFRSNPKKMNVTIGATFQAASLNAVNHSWGRDIRQSFEDVLPNALFQYSFSQVRNLRFEYNTSTTQPSVAQLQPVPDLSDPLNIKTGNADLKQSYNHNFSLIYFAAQPSKRRNFMFSLNLSKVVNAIVQSDSVTSFGTRTSRPVNANGVGNLFSNVGYGFPLGVPNMRMDVGSFFTYSKNIAFVNGESNSISSFTFRPNVSFNYDLENKMTLELRAAVSFYSGKYSLQPALNTNYIRQSYGINMTNYLPKGFYAYNEFSYVLNSSSTGGYNANIPLWNVSVAKTFLKNDRGELKLGVMDLLNQNTGITRTVNQGSIVDQRYNVLQRYFLLTFTYSISKAGLKAKGGMNIRIRSMD
ncbi:MAG: outer membrane beta-barrel protein [Bacteroidetes bacterium]|nr:outer membrane beta-barrel protein [Bacteroidota bacterium]